MNQTQAYEAYRAKLKVSGTVKGIINGAVYRVNGSDIETATVSRFGVTQWPYQVDGDEREAVLEALFGADLDAAHDAIVREYGQDQTFDYDDVMGLT